MLRCALNRLKSRVVERRGIVRIARRFRRGKRGRQMAEMTGGVREKVGRRPPLKFKRAISFRGRWAILLIGEREGRGG